MLLAFSAPEDELDVLCVSVTFGNVEVEKYVLHRLPFSKSQECDRFERARGTIALKPRTNHR